MSTTSRQIATAALLIAGGNILSRLLGFIREPVIAALFGATGQADALEVATRIPQFVHELVIGGAVSGALIPVFSEMAHDEDGLRRTFTNVLSTVVLIAIASVVVLVLLAEPLVDLAAIGLPTATRDLAVTMTRITLPSTLLLGISAVTAARLYARNRFAYPAFSTASLNATLIIFALALTPIIGPPGVALGYLAGAVVHLLVQVPGLARDRARLTRPDWLDDPKFRQVLRLYAPIAIGLVVAQALVIVDTNLASRTGEGSLATMRFATRLQQLPLGLIATAVSLAFLPVLSRTAPSSIRSLSSATEFRQHLSVAVKTAAVLIVPITVLMTTMSTPIVRLVYERGAFDAAATAPTGLALLIYSIQLPLTALDQLFIVTFYAMRNTITPVVVGIASGVVYLAIALTLVEPFGMFGLITANTVQNSVHGLVMGTALWWLIRGSIGRGNWVFAVKLVVSGTVMALVALAIRDVVRTDLEPDGRMGWLTLLLAGGAALVTYLAAIAVLGIGEIAKLRLFVLQAIARRRINST